MTSKKWLLKTEGYNNKNLFENLDQFCNETIFHLEDQLYLAITTFITKDIYNIIKNYDFSNTNLHFLVSHEFKTCFSFNFHFPKINELIYEIVNENVEKPLLKTLNKDEKNNELIY